MGKIGQKELQRKWVEKFWKERRTKELLSLQEARHFIADCPEMSSKDKNKRNTS
ncbi:hypothetical protein A2U01_0087369, partial [Trifolium medium]|nr:hypothetical protein [Trifolium medium]